MTRVVVDASVIVAAAMADGKTRRTLLSVRHLDLFAPAFIDDELRRQIPRIAGHAGASKVVVEGLIDECLRGLKIVPRAGYEPSLSRATELVKLAGAEGDEDYAALALTLGAPIWTLDHDFDRIRGVRTVSRTEVEAPDAGLT